MTYKKYCISLKEKYYCTLYPTRLDRRFLYCSEFLSGLEFIILKLDMLMRL